MLPRFAELRDKIGAIMPGLKERAKTLVELVDGARFLFDQRPLKLNDKAKAILTPEARKLLKVAIPVLEKTDWNSEALDRHVRLVADNENVKLAAVAQPLRAALTGRSTSTGIFDVLVALGKEESLARLRDQASVAAAV
jgi:glutamyl-tRNA synthetase